MGCRRRYSTSSPVATATVNGREWHREPGEPKEAFLGCVTAEASANAAGLRGGGVPGVAGTAACLQADA
jgi:hypothetical protein